MKLVKGFLIFTLTLFASVLAIVIYSSTNKFIPVSIVIALFLSLIYLIQPLGTMYPEKAFIRFFFILGAWLQIIAIDIFFTAYCPNPLFGLPSMAFYSTLINLVCETTGKIPASIIMSLLGFYIVYLGYTKNLTIQSKGTVAMRQPLI